MVVYPLSAIEDKAIWWASRIVPAVAAAIIVFLGAVSFAATQV